MNRESKRNDPRSTTNRRCPRICCSPTVSAASRRTAANTAYCRTAPVVNQVQRIEDRKSPIHDPRSTIHDPRSCRPLRGSMWWPIRVCGFLVSESGLGYTWAGNSQQYRLTPWSNDPVSDPPAEVLYLRDEETGELWTPTPRPLGLDAPTLVRHGQGYTRFEQRSHGLTQELRVFVSAEEPVKMIVLRVWNSSNRTRRLSATFYAEWVLGTVRDQSAMNVRTRDRRGERGSAGAEPVRGGLRRPGGLRRRERAAAHRDWRSHRVSGPQRLLEAPAALVACESVRPRRAGAGPVRRRAGGDRSAARARSAKSSSFSAPAGDVNAVRDLLRRYKERRAAFAPPGRKCSSAGTVC